MMNTETRAFLEQLRDTLASKRDLVALEERFEEKVNGRTERSQEKLARMAHSGFAETKTLHGETLGILHRIADALDVDTQASSGVRVKAKRSARIEEKRCVDASSEALEEEPS